MDVTLRGNRQKLKYSIQTHFANTFSTQSTSKSLDKLHFEWPTERLYNYLNSVITVIKTLKITQLHFQVRLMCKWIVKTPRPFQRNFPPTQDVTVWDKSLSNIIDQTQRQSLELIYISHIAWINNQTPFSFFNYLIQTYSPCLCVVNSTSFRNVNWD